MARSSSSSTHSLRTTLPLLCLLALAWLPAASASAAPAHDPRGFLYGRITTTKDQVYEGRLRWGNEEAFWGDFFNARKENLPEIEHIPLERRRHEEKLEAFGVPLGIRWREDNDTSHLAARFGDLRRIEVDRKGNHATVTLKSGVRFEVEGGSNDVEGSTVITVWDRQAGEVQVEWRHVHTIHFLPTPANLAVPGFRLRGTVHTAAGAFRGYIQWDQDECLSDDELNGISQGDENEGAQEVSLRMGEIRSIEPQGNEAAKITLKNGRTWVLRGTNDVDVNNRGIIVHDPRFGRVLVHWGALRRVDFDPPGDSGPAYTDFRPGRPLTGTVHTAQGKTLRGRLLYDANRVETMEVLEGQRNDVEYNIPFARVASLVPEGKRASRVIYKDGKELKLEVPDYVHRDNLGVLVFEGGRKIPRYIPWEDVRRIDFEGR